MTGIRESQKVVVCQLVLILKLIDEERVMEMTDGMVLVGKIVLGAWM